MPQFSAPDGTKLHFSDEGLGQPVLALAGLTRNGTDFDYLAPHLEGVRLIRLDYRGRGQSEWADPATYTIHTEAGDAIALLDHLDLDKAAVIGTSRGGLIAMVIAATARKRLAGVALVDIGPDLDQSGLDVIRDYIGRNPQQKTLADAAVMRAKLMVGFENVSDARWAEEAARHYIQTPDGLTINYDPKLRDAVLSTGEQPAPDLWPLFEALNDLPLALIRGANSNLLSAVTTAKMRTQRPDMIFAEVPGRGHVPFLDEPQSLDALRAWLEKTA